MPFALTAYAKNALLLANSPLFILEASTSASLHAAIHIMRRERMRKFALLSMMLGLLLPSISVANPTQVLVRGGILCDTQEQLETLLTGISLSGGNEIPEVNGCGKFAPEQPVTMIVTPLEWYVTPLATSLIGQFVYFQNGWTQYGWLEYVMNPDYEENIELGEAL